MLAAMVNFRVNLRESWNRLRWACAVKLEQYPRLRKRWIAVRSWIRWKVHAPLHILIRTRAVRAYAMKRIPADSNPFHYDLYHMGTDLVRGWLAMHEGYDRKESPEPLRYLILINMRTGKRIKVMLPQD